MDILLVSSEIAPFLHKTEVAEVVAALSKTMRQVGHSVTVVVPFSTAYEEGGLLLARRLTPLKLDEQDSVTVCDTQLTSGVQLSLLQLGPETNGRGDLPQTYRFARAVAAWVHERREIGVRIEVIHVLDWLGALVGVAVQALRDPPPVVMTVHDLSGQGDVARAAASDSSLGSLSQLPQLALGAELNAAAAALRTAKCVTTVSDAYANQLKDPAVSGELAALFQELSPPIIGIAAGIDYSRYNPTIDPFTVARYDAEDHAPKAICKTALQREVGLELDLDTPLFFHPGPLTNTAVGRVVVESLERLLDQPLSLVIGKRVQDDESLVREVEQLAQKWPGRVALQDLSAPTALHRAISGADFALLTSQKSPLETIHLFAQRYGTLPVAIASGVFADSLVDCDAKMETGHAFVFEQPTTDEVLGAVARALSAYRQPEFARLRRRAMKRDLGWERPTRRMVQVYRQALGIHL